MPKTPPKRYTDPAWLLKPKRVSHYTSSTVGQFAPEQAIKNDHGFKGRMFPGSETSTDEYMTILLHDVTLSQQNAAEALRSAHVIHHYLNKKVKFYMIRKGVPELLEITGEMGDFDKIDENIARDILVQHSGIPADDIVVCNYEKMNELWQIVTENDPLTEGHLTERLADYWLSTGTLPQGQVFPPIILTDDFIKTLGPRGMATAQNTELRFEVPNATRKSLKPIPLEKIISLQITSLEAISKLPPLCEMPALKSLEVLLDHSDRKYHPLTHNPFEGTMGIEGLTLIRTRKNNSDPDCPPGWQIEPDIMKCVTASLTALVISGYGASFFSWNYFHLMKHLTILCLNYSTIDANYLAMFLRNNIQMTSLVLNDCTIRNPKCPIKDIPLTSLEMLHLKLDDNSICNELFQAATKVKSLTLLWRQQDNPSILANACMPEITDLNMERSCFHNPGDASCLIFALMLSRKVQTLNLSHMSLSGDNKKISWDAVVLDQVTDLNLYGVDLPSDHVGNLLKTMHKLEVLNFESYFSHSSHTLSFTLSGHSFAHLKILNVRNRIFDNATFGGMLKQTKILKSLNISITSGFSSLPSFKSRSISCLLLKDITFDELEELDISGLTFTSFDLECMIEKMPKLRILKMKGCIITGKTLNCKQDRKLIHIDMREAKIDLNVIDRLLSGLNPISVQFPATDPSTPYASPSIDYTLRRFKDYTKTQLIALNTSGDRYGPGDAYIERFPTLRKIDISNTDGREIIFYTDITHKNITELFMNARKVKEEELIALLKTVPNLKVLAIDSEFLTENIISFIKNGPFTHKNKLVKDLKKQMAEYARDRRQDDLSIAIQDVTDIPDIMDLKNTIIGYKKSGVVYDTLTDYQHIPGDLLPQQDPSFKLQPLFQLIQGPDLHFENIRLWSYKPDFESDPDRVVKNPIKRDLKPYHIKPCSHLNPSLYRQPSYQTTFNKPMPDLGLPYPWICLRSLSCYDQLLRLGHNINPDDLGLYYSDPDGFYYLCVKPGKPIPPSISLNYDISAEKREIYAYPPKLAEILRPFKRNYRGMPDPDFNILTLKQQLDAIFNHPEYHVCAPRSESFLYQVLKNAPALIEDYRDGGSGSHQWPEIKYQGVWYLISVGGALAKLEYLPYHEQEDPDDDTLTLIPTTHSQSPIVQPIIPQPQQKTKKPSDMITEVSEINSKLKIKKPNTNILLICKNDEYNKHLKATRRYLRSLAPLVTTVVDHHESALSSDPYIQFNPQEDSWDHMDPKGAEGWLANRFKHDNGQIKQERLIIDWSSLTPNQSAKLNSAIDLEHRSLDGVSLTEDVQVIGLICENDPRLKDSAFLSRHRGHIYHVNCKIPIPSTSAAALSTLPIELYHTPLWKKLLLGQLGFHQDEPIHTKKELLLQKQSCHLILNNPPEHCEEFDRFIQAIEDGHEFQYHDKSIILPKMTVSLTHGYDFTKAKMVVISVNENVSYDDLQCIQIDHVITPSTFERCLHNHVILEQSLCSLPGWFSPGKIKPGMSLYITKTLSNEQYAFLIKNARTLRLYLAPGVTLPPGLSGFKPAGVLPFDNKKHTNSEVIIASPWVDTYNFDKATIIDVSELNSDDVLYGFKYHRLENSKKIIFTELVSDLWLRLEKGEHIVLTGEFSDELIDHLSTLLLPSGYLWHEGMQKPYEGRLTLMPNHPIESLTWIKQQQSPDKRPLPAVPENNQIIANEADRKPALLAALKKEPAVFIEGKPGIGKSYFIHELKKDPGLKCYSHHGFNNKNLKAWATSKDPRITLLIIDEATSRGTDWSLFKSLYTRKREILIDGIHKLDENKKVLFIGNRVKHMPTLLQQPGFPTLTFNDLSPDSIVNRILMPIFAEVDAATAEQKAQAFYDEYHSTLDVRGLQAQAILLCAQHVNDLPSWASDYAITTSRQAIFQSIVDSIRARDFMQNAKADSAKYGGKTGHMLQGLPGSGKSDIIHTALKFMGYKRCDIAELYQDDPHDNTLKYYHIRASCNIRKLRKHLNYAFLHNCKLMIDELDALLKPDRPDLQDELDLLSAELNSYLMGENLEGERLKGSGLTLWCTGNGITFHGRAALSESLQSRLHIMDVPPYTYDECVLILKQKYPNLHHNHSIRDLVMKYIADPKGYTFRDLLVDTKQIAGKLNPSFSPQASPNTKNSTTHTAAPIIYHFYNTHSFKISLSTMVVGVGIGLGLIYLSKINSLPIIAAIAVASAIITAVIAACYLHYHDKSTVSLHQSFHPGGHKFSTI